MYKEVLIADVDRDIMSIKREVEALYHYNLMPQRLKELAKKGPIVYDAFVKDIKTFKACLPEF
jgi:hypothetical protein